MCYTAQTSLHAFLFGVISSVILIMKSNSLKMSSLTSDDIKIIGIFFLFVSLMQIYDYIFWSFPNSRLNEITTKVACLTNHLQPLVLFLLLLYFKKSMKWSYLIIGIYIILVGCYTVVNFHKLRYTTVSPRSDPSLDWTWNHWKFSSIIYTMFLITLVTLGMEGFSFPFNISFVLLAIFTFWFSFYKYRIKVSTGRFWCYFSALIPVGILAFLLLRTSKISLLVSGLKS